MKKEFTFLLFCWSATASMAISSCSQEAERPDNPADAIAFDAPMPSPVEVGLPARKVEAILKVIKAEPKVIDAFYDPELVVPWVVSVTDDGSSRIGFASYICIILAEHSAIDENSWVRIVDHKKMLVHRDDYRSSSLGRYHCATDQTDPI